MFQLDNNNAKMHGKTFTFITLTNLLMNVYRATICFT